MWLILSLARPNDTSSTGARGEFCPSPLRARRGFGSTDPKVSIPSDGGRARQEEVRGVARQAPHAARVHLAPAGARTTSAARRTVGQLRRRRGSLPSEEASEAAAPAEKALKEYPPLHSLSVAAL